jgi:tetratricopeptide (TPR) repeat protein
LRILDLLIPGYVYETIIGEEAFVLIAATLLHDIGMVPREDASADLQYLTNLRQRHGDRGATIIREEFSDLLAPFAQILQPVCEIVKNHQGTFSPRSVAGLPYDLRADALWVRLADELDFGPGRGPNWLLDYVRPDQESLEHWQKHNELDEPSIDLDLFRIQVTGFVENKAIIRKLRAEFEAPVSQDLQKIFLSRGLERAMANRTFLVWDLTEVMSAPGEDSKEADARPAIFSNEQFLLGARYLYNLGRYETARKCFEDAISRLPGDWADMPALPYFYHYLKTLHAIGEHRTALEVADRYIDADFSPEIRAAIMVATGLGHWKLGDFNSAVNCFRIAVDVYRSLSERNAKHMLNEADAWVLYSIACLEKMRAPKGGGKRALAGIERGLAKAEDLFSEYEKQRPETPESHYKGRYWGLKAFYSLLQIDRQTGKDPDQWTEALKFAAGAHGGDEVANRNPFGAMCGKYCAAAVNYHKYRNCDDEIHRQQALLESGRIIKDVRQTYDDLFGPTKRIFRMWPKIHSLFVQVREALPDQSKPMLQGFYGSDESVEDVEIYTPLH